MEEAWNKNMADKFSPSLINVLNESMMGWYNKFDPGFMCVGWKPCPFGNESHTICCGLTSVLWRAHIVEGKDRPAQMSLKLHSDLGITVGFIILICEPLFSTGKYVVMDSVFFVSNGIVALVAKGVYVGALIKKRRYWPKSVAGDLIEQNFAYKEVGGVDMLEASTEDGKPFRVFFLKYPEYVMKVMASWMTLDDLGGYS